MSGVAPPTRSRRRRVRKARAAKDAKPVQRLAQLSQRQSTASHPNVQRAVSQGEARKIVSKSKANGEARDAMSVEARKASRAMSSFLARTGGLESGAIEIAQFLAAPSAYPPVRWTNGFGGSRTAVASPWKFDAVPFDTVNSGDTIPANALLPCSQMFVAAFRHPMRSLIIYDPNQAGATWSYPVTFASNVGQVTNYVVPVNVTEPAPILFAAASGTYQPHGSVVYPGRTGESGQSLLPATGSSKPDTLVVSVNNPALVQVHYSVLTWSQKDGVISGPDIVNSSATFNFSVTPEVTSTGYQPMSYVGFSIHSVSVSAVTATAALTGTGGCVFQHHALPDFQKNALSAGGVRNSAVSLMFSNTVAPVYREGELAGCQLPQNTFWVAAALDGFSEMASAEGATQIAADNGMYGWLRPTQTKDFDIRSTWSVDETGQLTDCWYPILPDSEGIYITSMISQPDAREGYLTVAWGIEYQTTDVWRATEVPSVRAQAWTDAVEVVSSMSQWHENPLHLTDIVKGVVNGARHVVEGILQYGPKVLTAAGSLSKLFG